MRARVFGPEIFGFCWSKALKDHGIVSFLKSWADLHRFEGLGRGSSQVCGGAWRRMQPFLGLKFLGSVDRGPMDLVVAPVLWKFSQTCADLNEKLRGTFKSLRPLVAVRGGSVAEDLSGSCTRKSLEDFCGLIFCEILSEILEIQNGVHRHCWICCHLCLLWRWPFWQYFDNPGREWFQVNHWVSPLAYNFLPI